MFSNLQIRPAKPHRRKPSLSTRAGVTKRRISHQFANASDVPSLSFMEGLFGDEFPEAFGSVAKKSSKSILDLPAELLAVICEDLSRLDIKRLRLASKYLAAKVDLRITKVYVSPNRANLECLHKILDHPRYRFKVYGFVWDDAQLEEYPDLESFRNAVVLDENNARRDVEHLLENISRGSQDEHSQFGAFEHDDFFDKDGRLTEVAKGILLRHDDQMCRDIIAKNATVMSIEESYQIYRDLYRDEKEIMKQGLDVAALKQVLAACPNLKRISLTNKLWLPWEFRPSHESPFYRSLPPGFRKPSVWPWLSQRPQSTSAQTAHREQTMSTVLPNQTDSLPSEWRGYSIIVSTLINTTPKPQITDFMIEPSTPTTGISHQLFATFNADWINSITLARTIPLTRLKLAINSFGSNDGTTASYLRAGQIHAFLRTCPLLTHLDLSPNCHARRPHDSPAVTESWFHYSEIIPYPLIQRLTTFTLRNANTTFEDLLDLTQGLASAHHIALDNIHLVSIVDDSTKSWLDYLRRMWSYYHVSAAQKKCTRPAFMLIDPLDGGCGACGACGTWRARLVYEEVGEYLHNGDYVDCPFLEGGGVREGVGWVVDERDETVCVRFDGA